jgi:BirA family transcriptional regulator, biotin operon repressor / biotin---[acetyl-CoA-carboxylase] ligase
MSAPLDPAQLRRALGGCTLGREIVVLEETTSTNDSVLERASPDVPEGLVVFAEHQTAGRGQRGNRWESAPRMGLWFSILLRPKIDIGQSPRLTAWAAEIVAETIRTEFGLSPAIKLPNDIQIDGRKVAGVLVEMRAQANARHVAIAGIGVNVNHVREDFSEELRERAISLAMALNREVDRDKLAIALLHNLDRSYPGIATVRLG